MNRRSANRVSLLSIQMKVAAIDIGTNSIRLLISESDGASLRTIERKMEITRIGKNLGITENISKTSADTTSKILKEYKSLMVENGVESYKAVGTSAVRKAANSGWFISYIKAHSGIEIEKISGKEEAYLSYYGATRELNKDSRTMVIDIGGGSTEFILGGKDSDVELDESIDIGSVNLSERFISGDKPDSGSLKDMSGYIKNRIKPVLRNIKEKDCLKLIGVAGTITTIAAIDLRLAEYDSTRIHHHLLAGKNILDIYNMLCGLTLKERRRVKGLQPERADIIIGGTAILIEILDILKIGLITVSEHDILDGIIYSLVKF